jgi:hypothetical protein
MVIGQPVQFDRIPGLDCSSESEELAFLSSDEEIISAIRAASDQRTELPAAFVIDAHALSGLPSKILVSIPETVAAKSRCFSKDHDSICLHNASSDPKKAIEILALASNLTMAGWPCLVVISQFTESNPAATDSSIHRLAETRSFGFRLVQNTDRIEAIRSAVRVINSLQCVGGTRFTVAEKTTVEPCECPPADTFLRQWEMEEFEHDDVISTVHHRLQCSEVMHHFDLRHVFLRATTLTRLMATRSFEHHSCDAQILLLEDATLQRLLESAEISELYSFHAKPATWFHRADPWLIENGIETALSEGSVLAVDRQTGRVFGVYELRTRQSTRFETHCRLTNKHKGAFVIAAMESGYVEVYHNNNLLLWYDRYRWRHEPFLQLSKQLNWLKIEETHQQKILGAIALLMDNKESSILVFPAEKQPHADLEEHLQELRPELGFRQTPRAGDLNQSPENRPRTRASLNQRSLTELTALSLAAILRMDGAHVIKNGQITNAAEQIVVKPKQPHSDALPTAEHQPGAGRAAANRLSREIDGCVVKVSASGELRIFRSRDHRSTPNQ